MFFCCLGGLARLACILDNFNHALRINFKPVCDWHDREIMKGYE